MTGHKPRTALTAPVSQQRVSSVEAAAQTLSMLRDDYNVDGIDTLPDFIVVVEGTSDRLYIHRAARLLFEATGERLLGVPTTLQRGPFAEAVIVVPGDPNQAGAGGVDRMVELAKRLADPFFGSGVLAGVLFVFDHDWAGRKGRDQISRFGYRPGIHSITLDPAEHPNSCSNKDVVVEDLLSLQLQKRFFALGGASCDLEYRNGDLLRIRWIHPSKGALRVHALSHGKLHDFMEVVRLASRIHTTLGFPLTVAPFRGPEGS